MLNEQENYTYPLQEMIINCAKASPNSFWVCVFACCREDIADSWRSHGNVVDPIAVGDLGCYVINFGCSPGKRLPDNASFSEGYLAHIKKMAADRRMAQKFFLIQVQPLKF